MSYTVVRALYKYCWKHFCTEWFHIPSSEIADSRVVSCQSTLILRTFSKISDAWSIFQLIIKTTKIAWILT